VLQATVRQEPISRDSVAIKNSSIIGPLLDLYDKNAFMKKENCIKKQIMRLSLRISHKVDKHRYGIYYDDIIARDAL